jgi:hypothetical protein
MTTGWFEHTRFVPLDARTAVSVRLDAYVDELRLVVGPEVDDDVTVHLSGSLSRHEPAVVRGEGGATLVSDLDIVVVAPGLRAVELASRLRTLMLERAPDLATTAFGVSTENLGAVQSFLAFDLAHCWSSPLLGTARGPVPFPRTATPADHFELLAHQLGGWLLYPENPLPGLRHFREERDAHRLKTALEALRLMSVCGGATARRYADLLEDDRLAAVRPVSPALVRELVRARECSLLPPVDDAGLRSLVLLAASRFLGCAPTTDAVVIAATCRADERPHLLDVFPLALVLLALDSAAPGSEIDDALRRLLLLPPVDQLLEAESARIELADAGGASVRGRHLTAWLDLRERYYTWLGDKNFGRLGVEAANGSTRRGVAV